ncbi:hypothetical protein T492DRAFT_844362 [Pavlovales sp. CCMP2436]|nr:hypothetical protein T492DRAFT_844362 [Pavlovales sp. CCMP2436]
MVAHRWLRRAGLALAFLVLQLARVGSAEPTARSEAAAAPAPGSVEPSARPEAAAAPAPVAGPLEADFEARSTACASELKSFCSTVEPGRNRLLGCLMSHGPDALHKPVTADASSSMLGDECRRSVLAYRQELAAHPLTMNIAMRLSCAADVPKLCAGVGAGNGTLGEGEDELRVKQCLIAHKSALSTGCRQAILAVQIAGASSIELEPLTMRACASDLNRTCSNVRHGDGRVRGCLFRHRAQLSAPCFERLLASEAARATDIRLQPRLMQACLADSATFCPGLPLSDGRLTACLALHKHEQGMSHECTREVEQFQEIHVTSIKLDPRIAKLCRRDVARLKCLRRGGARAAVPQAQDAAAALGLRA